MKKMEYTESIPGDFVVRDPETGFYYRGHFSGGQTSLATKVVPEEDWSMDFSKWEDFPLDVEVLDEERVLVHWVLDREPE